MGIEVLGVLLSRSQIVEMDDQCRGEALESTGVRNVPGSYFVFDDISVNVNACRDVL